MCLFPINAQRQESGRPKLCLEGDLRLPCGTCTECLKKRSMEWALRAKHEISLHTQNCFLTLTYDDDHLPSHLIVKSDFQKLLKKLRKKHKLRYMVSYEYGTHTYRPHMHAIIFGYSPDNQIFLKNTKKGEAIYTSKEITKHWDYGFHSIGTANEKTAYYIASYSLKGKKHEFFDPQGEWITVKDSMNSSKNPAIGLEYLKQNKQQLVDSGQILPRYYLKILAKIAPDLLQQYEDKTILDLITRSSQENLSKFVIDQQKLDTQDTEYRKNTIDKKLIKMQKSLLTEDRNLYVSYTKEKNAKNNHNPGH